MDLMSCISKQFELSNTVEVSTEFLRKSHKVDQIINANPEIPAAQLPNCKIKFYHELNFTAVLKMQKKNPARNKKTHTVKTRH